MRDRNALVTCDVPSESRHPVPSRPYPARPALYRTTRVETSIHSSSSVIAEPGIEWMEDFDFISDVPCADPSHEHAADVRIACRCPKCGTLGDAVCWYWWARLMTEPPLTHVPCGIGIPMESLRIVEVLR